MRTNRMFTKQNLYGIQRIAIINSDIFDLVIQVENYS
jgi:hypothetical protein